MTSGGWILWWAGSLMMFSLALLFASPLADSGLFDAIIRVTGFLGLAVPATSIGMGRRRADAARDELLTREQAARTEAEATNRSKEEFFATISHELRGSPPPDPRGTPTETPDDRRALMEQLRDMNEQLIVSSMREQDEADGAQALRIEAEADNRLKDEFLAVVSHELRTPLNAIMGWARLLGSDQLNPERTPHAIATIERNAKALARIIEDLLDVSRIIGGSVHIEKHPVDLVAVVQGALDEVKPAAAARVLDVKLIWPERMPEPVAGDVIRLQQIVANLVSNAIKFTPPQGRIEVRLTTIGSEAVIQVSDTGQGIAPDFLPHVFERFTQADASTTRRHGGLGLGLAIVRALVERHGGTVQAESPGLGRGATFTVRLPTLASQGAAPEATPGRTVAHPSAGQTLLDGVRVLVVEDDPDGRDAVVLFLRLAGADVVAAQSVREAMNTFDRTRPDVILSDIGLPGEDGFALVRQVRAREAGEERKTPVVALTGYVRPEDRSRMSTAGFQAHVSKPFDVEELVGTVASLAATGSN